MNATSTSGVYYISRLASGTTLTALLQFAIKYLISGASGTAPAASFKSKLPFDCHYDGNEDEDEGLLRPDFLLSFTDFCSSSSTADFGFHTMHRVLVPFLQFLFVSLRLAVPATTNHGARNDCTPIN
ncbi:hypothetical protein V5799_006587 [Amblyomma americanum]|uniref:Uncharacterized protein n=1 Tax=Amblyomma americanum TaxID=6943 RepID=A0AAQ4DW01_AMBAM